MMTHEHLNRYANTQRTNVAPPVIDRTTIAVWLASLVAFGVRAFQLDGVTLAWDEGWSLGLSALPVAEINRITALDVHPPLYYLLLKVWMLAGRQEFTVRFLSLLAGVLAVPMAYAVGRAWHSRRVGLLAAWLITFAPALVYYSQVARMFSLSVFWLLLATYGLLQAVHHHRRWAWAVLILGALGSLLTFYYTGLVIAALGVYALLAAPRRVRQTVSAFAAVGLLYLPWVVYVAGALTTRVARRTGFTFDLTAIAAPLRAGVFAVVFSYSVGWPAVYAVGLITAAGLIAGWRRWNRRLWLPILPILFTLVGVAVGTQAHMFAARYVIGAVPFLALLLAWNLDALGERTPVALVAGLLLLGLAAGPTLASYVYAKPYERFAPFDPSADWRALREAGAQADDVVFFNVLSLAGTYSRYRQAGDPSWSYALRWDPVIEPLDLAIARIQRAAVNHTRLWFVLYKGTYGANAELKAWLDANLYPAFGQWREDTLYLAYVSPQAPWTSLTPRVTFGEAIQLIEARFTPTGHPAGGIAVRLTWQAAQTLERNYKVFVHLYGPDGRLITQHDAQPANDTRPTSTWSPGQPVQDRHGLLIPPQAPAQLRLAVGLYDPETGERLRLANGDDTLTLGVVTLTAPTATP